MLLGDDPTEIKPTALIIPIWTAKKSRLGSKKSIK